MNIVNLIKSAGLNINDFPDSVLDKQIAIVTDKSDEVTVDTLFVAISGLNNDGHEYVAQAAKQGAIAAVVEHVVKVDIPQFQVSDSRKALAYLMAAFYEHPAKDLSIIGVTGTNGKTTTTSMIHHILSQKEKNGLIGSVGVNLGDCSIKAKATTPDATLLQYYLWRMKENGLSSATIEVSSHGLELQRVAGIPFSIVGITNVTTDHLDFHGTMNNYALAKSKLFHLLQTGGVGFYNSDDKLSEKIAKVTQEKLFSFGQDGTADIQFSVEQEKTMNIKFSKSFQKYCILSDSSITIQLSVFGLHNMYNAALALGISLTAGATLEEVACGLSNFTSVHRRLQLIHNKNYMIIDDYAHNPDGIKSAIQTVARLKPSTLLVVYSIRGNRGIVVNRENGEELHHYLTQLQCPVKLWVTTSQDVATVKDKVSSQEEHAFYQGIGKVSFEINHEPNLEQTLKEALDQVQKGDMILLLGAQGMDEAQKIISGLLTEVP